MSLKKILVQKAFSTTTRVQFSCSVLPFYVHRFFLWKWNVANVTFWFIRFMALRLMKWFFKCLKTPFHFVHISIVDVPSYDWRCLLRAKLSLNLFWHVSDTIPYSLGLNLIWESNALNCSLPHSVGKADWLCVVHDSFFSLPNWSCKFMFHHNL